MTIVAYPTKTLRTILMFSYNVTKYLAIETIPQLWRESVRRAIPLNPR